MYTKTIVYHVQLAATTIFRESSFHKPPL